MNTTRRAFVSFSGGKDSMLALHRARELGVEIVGVLCMLEETSERSRSHGVPRVLVEAQGAALGLQVVCKAASWSDYEASFIATLRELREAHRLTEMVFGDIDLDPHREWEEKVCAAAELRALLPLWHLRRDEVVREVLSLGIRARIVCVNGKWLGESFAGRIFDESLLNDLPEGVDHCGENGEFHTFVFDGPGFVAPVEHRVARVSRHDAKHAWGDATYYFAELEGQSSR